MTLGRPDPNASEYGEYANPRTIAVISNAETWNRHCGEMSANPRTLVIAEIAGYSSMYINCDLGHAAGAGSLNLF